VLENILFLTTYILILVGAARPMSILIGKILKWRWKYLIISAGGATLPVIIILYGVWFIHVAGAGQEPNDINGLAAFFLMLLPLLLMPFSFIVAARTFRKHAPAAPHVSSQSSP
jgi:hypothetical protein